ncbi:N-6 DNA methylase [Mycoplasmopsis canis]|uniref:N-6 DNA methylase n=1 Tax=Mycoplasmopsis canis TaxID=29555 RepID=UPI002961EB3A|nr:N-6 DNA methylase [Mycoplasmopsis canis]
MTELKNLTLLFLTRLLKWIFQKLEKNSLVCLQRFELLRLTLFIQQRKIVYNVVDDEVVYGCISMPSNVFANTGTNVSVLLFDKKQKHDKVILIDASKLGEEYQEGKNKKKRLTNDDIDLIIKTFNGKEVVDNFSVAVTYDEFKEKNYSLSAGQYFEIKIDYIDMSEEEFENKMSEYKNELLSLFGVGE